MQQEELNQQKFLSSIVLFNSVGVQFRIHCLAYISPTTSSIRHRPNTRILTLRAHRSCVMSNIVLPAPDLTLILYYHATAAVKTLQEIGGTITGEIVGVANTGTG